MEWFYPLLVKASPILLESAGVSAWIGLVGGSTYLFAPYIFDCLGLHDIKDEIKNLQEVLTETINVLEEKSFQLEQKKIDMQGFRPSLEKSLLKNSTLPYLEKGLAFEKLIDRLEVDVETLKIKQVEIAQLLDVKEENQLEMIKQKTENLNMRTEQIKKYGLAVQLGLFAGSVAFFYFFGVSPNLNKLFK